MAKSFYHMSHKLGKFSGDYLYSNKKSGFTANQELVVISGNEVGQTKVPYLEGFFTVDRVEEGQWNFGGTVYSFRANFSHKLVPAKPLNLKEYKQQYPEFKNRFQNQMMTELRSNEYDYLKALISNNTSFPNKSNEIYLENDIANILQGPTEKSLEIMSRLGQGKFRNEVARVWNNRKEVCAVTLIDMTALLNASHIVPWKDCVGEKEPWRLDGANGILLCAHYDRLFDRHLITFERRGLSCPIKFSKQISKNTKLALGLSDDIEVTPNQMSTDDLKRFQKYLGIHNQRFFELEKQRSS